jgi:hypothetical protein
LPSSINNYQDLAALEARDGVYVCAVQNHQRGRLVHERLSAKDVQTDITQLTSSLLCHGHTRNLSYWWAFSFS